MHSQNEETIMFKKKKPTFAEWTLQNGVSVNNKPSTTVGAIHESPVKATTSRASSNPAKTSDPFLEGFYSVEDKPETKKKTICNIGTPLQSRPMPRQPLRCIPQRWRLQFGSRNR